jgi:hypothetical protein
MNIREILAALDQLRALYAACGPKAAEKNIAKVIELLAPHDDKPIEAFIMDVRAAATSAEARTAAPATAVDQAVVDQYAHLLAAAGTEERVFEETFAALTGDANVRLKEADTIARQFTGQQSPFKTRKAALTAIKQAFVERARFENKLRAVS